MIRRAPFTWVLLISITIISAYELLTGAFTNLDQLEKMGAIVPGLLQRHEYWRLVAAMFLHANLLHWLVNTWALFQLGTLYEVFFGTKRFAFVYIVSGIVASAASSMYTHVSVGASGAISGVVGAFIFSVLRSPRYRHDPQARDLIGQLAFWIVVNGVIGMSIKYIDNVAHAAGFVTGLLLGLMPHRVPPPSPQEQVIDVTPRG